MATLTYFDLAERGLNHWWRYLLSLVLLVLTQLLYLIPAIVLIRVYSIDVDTLSAPDEFLLIMTSFLFLLLGLWLAVRYIHRRPFLSLISPYRRFNFRAFFYAALVYALISGLFQSGYFWLFPHEFEWTFEAKRFFPMLALVLLFIPMQASTEELLLRGYVTQGLKRVIGRWSAIMISSALFAALHWENSEVQSQKWIAMLTIFAIGLFFALITLKSNGLEMAMGIHTVNNILAFSIVTLPNGTATTPALWTFHGDPYTWWQVLSQVLVMGIVWMILFRGLRLIPQKDHNIPSI